jgi:Zn-dependent protease
VSEEPQRCAGCGVELAPGMVACPACRKLVHTDRLRALAAEAATAEREARLTDALRAWREALSLLPEASTQRKTVEDTIRRLSEGIDRSGSAPPVAKPARGRATAGLGAAALALWKLKFFFLSLLGKAKLLVTGLASLPTLLSMMAWLALDRGRGISFALGLVLSIYVHEMGHVAALRLYGIPATAPMFVPGLGALVRLRQYPIDAREDARVGLAGPIWGCAAAVLAIVPGLWLHDRTWLSVASVGATINLFNLIPVWQLDGARGFRALDVRQRVIVTGIAAGVALLFDQPMGWLVCAAGGFRLKSDLPARGGDTRAFWTFATLLAGLSLLAWSASTVAASTPTPP